MPDTTLLLLANDVRNKTFKMLDGVTDEMAHFAPPGLHNTILWHAGHVLIVNEHLGVAPATGRQPLYPEGWFETFSWKSTPADVRHWPTMEELKAKLKDQIQRLTTAIQPLTEEQLSRVIDPAKNRTLRWSILHGLHDEANHQGEMWLLRKMYERRAR